jgi:GTPase SAR1 family protein
MTTETREILVMGLPEAGKTTFIAALWHVISTKEIPSELQMAELQPSRDHLNSISKRWRECVAVERTIQGKDRKVTMNLQTADGARG